MLCTCNYVNETLNKYLFSLSFLYIFLNNPNKFKQGETTILLIRISKYEIILANYSAWPDIKVYIYFSMTGEKYVLIM